LDGFSKHSGLIADLFKRVNPLASQSRGHKTNFKVISCIDDVKQIFNQYLIKNKIDFSIICDSNIKLYGWHHDLYIAIANLVENSIYWLNSSDLESKEISINVRQGTDFIIVDYQDNGPGLTKEEIETEIIFEPGYSKKIDGTGLGLAIAGEAIERLDGKLIAHESVSGVYFQIEIKTQQ
jgi:signal transduction histidine kinase